jgi:hypothetical protein
MWTIIKNADLNAWQKKLYACGADIFQLPSWLNAFKKIGYLKPLYLGYNTEKHSGYCGLLVADILFIKVALVPGRPVMTEGAADIACYISLLQFLKNKGFTFARFTGNCDKKFLEQAASGIISSETFPFYRNVASHFYIPAKDTPEELKRGFNATAKRLINRIANDSNYRIVIDDTGEYLAEAYALFLKTGKRKGFKYRPYEGYKALFDFNADKVSYTTLYLCYYYDKLVNAILVVRNKNTSMYMSGALDGDHITTNDTPAFYLHYRAMLQEFYVHHTHRYDLVYTPGRFGDFKTRFHPERLDDPRPSTIVLNKWKYGLYTGTVLKVSSHIKRLAKLILSREKK